MRAVAILVARMTMAVLTMAIVSVGMFVTLDMLLMVVTGDIHSDTVIALAAALALGGGIVAAHLVLRYVRFGKTSGEAF